VVSEDGTPSVECWEFTNMVNEMQVQQRGGSKGTAHSMSLATARELDGVDILTWPSYAPLWPPPPDVVQAEWLDLSSFNRYVTFEIHPPLHPLSSQCAI